MSGSDADALRVRSSIIFSARSCDIGRSLVRIASNHTVLSVSAVNSTRSPGFRPMAERIFAGIVTWPFFVNFVIVDTVPMARLIEQPKCRLADTGAGLTLVVKHRGEGEAIFTHACRIGMIVRHTPLVLFSRGASAKHFS